MRSYYTFGEDDCRCYINKKSCKDWRDIGRVIAKEEYGLTPEEWKLYKKELRNLISKNSYDIETEYLKYSHYDKYEETPMYLVEDTPKEGYTAFWTISILIVDDIGEIIRKHEESKTI